MRYKVYANLKGAIGVPGAYVIDLPEQETKEKTLISAYEYFDHIQFFEPVHPLDNLQGCEVVERK